MMCGQHMKEHRTKNNRKHKKKIKCCSSVFCFGHNVIHLRATVARSAHKVDLKQASLLHFMTFNHLTCEYVYVCVCGAYEFAVNCRANRILLTLVQTSSIQLLPTQNIHNFVVCVRRRMELVQSVSTHTYAHMYLHSHGHLGTYAYVYVSIYKHSHERISIFVSSRNCLACVLVRIRRYNRVLHALSKQ